ncbi:hypothetical protein NIES2135_61160 (plasmid) [Leptolyngbya boryana NIES-2135]|jgi:hypothetical protein|uniref:Uncharacterized protein n=1 Tax=Leptolyngbya boryana NIES-2135 TaxID=1973484 RepID=A0A1Z4JRA0_LEPBY|nr:MULTISPECIES: hypothetical protein [Leptolyngbya]BAY59239.1 hypothetical protein NIES2135_61160 [Leptolyngbya boryana NIES-2135]MBD2372830.1 hypothetical protein [Leptolyngbya sp. FACHB-238]MBD2397417.1 hypothetical protein [Leptolyngbya sp. FACHB-239]MBD2403778.1 hypothetical protein [Leptolyngbya sp. FACHB-402]ULP33433.1 hypothetical protein MCP04_30350 [Leptolyngbya boryana IU 594]
MKRKDVDEFEKLCGQLQSTYHELSALSKKSPNDAVNTFKLKFVNRLLNQSNSLLGDKYRPFDDFFEFDTDDVPKNSDAVFMLSQYIECFEKFRADSIIYKSGWKWVVDAEEGEKGDEQGFVYIETIVPKRLRYK